MIVALIVLIVVMGIASLAMMFMAMCEFVLSIRSTHASNAAAAAPAPIIVTAPAPQPEPKNEAPIPSPTEEKPAPVAAEEPVCAKVEEPAPKIDEKVEEPVVEEPAAEEAAEEDDGNNVSFELSATHRQTLEEAYALLTKVAKGRFDKIVAAAKELPMARFIESTYAYTVMQGRDTIARLRILRGKVTLDCTVVNADLVKYNKENGKKIRNKPVRFRIEDKEELEAAIYTMQVANQAALDTRNVRKKAEKTDAAEK